MSIKKGSRRFSTPFISSGFAVSLLTLLLNLTLFLNPVFAQSVVQVETSREKVKPLFVPDEEDSFTFLVFGDKAAERHKDRHVLPRAVEDANRLQPSFVMNVGDMVQGYCATPQWMKEAQLFKSIMDRLECPWFPTAGNHDVHWNPKGGQVGGHDADYEAVFGPLWYAFEYKNYWFVVLYTDEGHPETGEKNYGQPECQMMSDSQLNWLKSVLKKAKNSSGIFLFQHHPRWFRGGYGDDWDKVHAELVKAGNVKAVFAGHYHQMMHETRDGIEYYVLAVTGGGLSEVAPEKGQLQEFHHVSVRGKRHPKITVIPVGTTLKP